LNLNDNIFGIDVNENAMHLAVQNQLANKRQGTQSTKTRSEVRGGGQKALETKRHRQGKTWQHPFRSVGKGWYSVWTQAQKLQIYTIA
jgi:ribosomal protein L4